VAEMHAFINKTQSFAFRNEMQLISR